MPNKEAAKRLATLSEDEIESLPYLWELWARPKQLPPHKWPLVWLILAGRGFGKTRTGAETLRMMVESGESCKPTIIAPTAGDARDIMIEGESGLLSVFPGDSKPLYQSSKCRIVFANGVTAAIRSAEEPERLRGLQHDFVWCDEIASWRYLREAWDMMMLGLRLGKKPRVIATTTPKPLRLIKELINSDTTAVTRGSTFENRDNLAAPFFDSVVSKYEGTRIGRQELYAEILEDIEGSLWTYDMLDKCRVKKAPDLARIVVAVDPAVTSNKHSDETGIIVAGIGVDNQCYVLADLSCRLSPQKWADRAVYAYNHYQADRIIAEVNQGGDIVEQLIRSTDNTVSYQSVRATRGKKLRAEPVSALYEQGRVHHVGQLLELETQMTSFVPGTGKSPDRVDAMVWAITELILQKSKPRIRKL